MIKKINLLTIMAAMLLLFGVTGCFQDLGQDDLPMGTLEGYDGSENLGTLGECLYMPFENNTFSEVLNLKVPAQIGNASPVLFESGKKGKCYKGLALPDTAYLSHNLSALGASISKELSATFWYKIGSGSRAGILVCGSKPNERKFGFRFFREGGATNQTFKLNVGNGTGETWCDGGAAATLNPVEVTDWTHFAFVIKEGWCAVYINGVMVKEATFTGSLSLTNCPAISIGSGAPSFTEWNHLHDDSQIDELRVFNKALTEAEISGMYNSGE